jgi:hypothetical protein
VDGYRVWSVTYDQPGNPLTDLEQPVIWHFQRPSH